MFFPGQGRELHRLTEDWWKNEMEDMEDTQNMTPAEARQIIKQSKDKVHLTAFYLGKDESKRESGRSLSEHLERKYMQGSTSEYRTLMDRLLSDKRIRPSEPTKPEDEVVTVSIYIAEHAVKRSGKNIESLSAGETFVAMLIALVSANVLSAAANVSFELTGGVACTGLCLQIHPHKKGEEIGTLVREVIDDHNKMVTDPDSKIVEAIGTQTEKFFSTANEEYLSKQSELFQMLSKKLAEGS